MFGPQQIENRINQNTEISRQVSLWDQRGSRVIRGDLLVIPIEESLLYVKPLYLQAEGGRIPELKRVVVAYENQVVMGETLDGALTELFGGAPGGGAAAAASGCNGGAGRADARDRGGGRRFGIRALVGASLGDSATGAADAEILEDLKRFQDWNDFSRPPLVIPAVRNA